MSVPEFATLTDDDLVTGEAVALDLPAAGLGTRMLSGLIDLTVTVAGLLLVLVVLAVATVGSDAALGQVASVGAAVLVLVVYPVTFETLTRGRSLGKLAVGTRTVRDDAGPISFQHAMVRALVGVVEIYATFGAAAFFAMLLTGRGKRLGDLAAGTYVVRIRVPLRLAAPQPMPPALAAWADGADVTSLPVGLALAVRQFLGRRLELQPTSRHAVAVRLARQTMAHVAPPPPPDTRPEDFLAAVVATRRDRDLARMRRDDALRHRLLHR